MGIWGGRGGGGKGESRVISPKLVGEKMNTLIPKSWYLVRRRRSENYHIYFLHLTV